VGDTLRRRIKQSKFRHPAQEAILNVLVAAGHLREQVDAACLAEGITQPQYNVLRILRGAHPDGYSRCEVAARMLERAPDVTRLIDRLEASGLVGRGRGEEDRRLSVTRITDAGLALLRRLDGPIDGISHDVARRVSARDLRTLSRICEHIYRLDEAG
jgi:DNA-binding MarR family transcriptional regulator